ncbi:MAG: hypothetical protein ABFD54_14920 [Armatimonadota bacterium]|nr:KTSC domain-containing protein [bacterium]
MLNWISVNSNLIDSLFYEQETKTLHLRMRSGQIRKYQGSVAAEYKPLLTWDDPDLYFLNMIDKCTRVD